MFLGKSIYNPQDNFATCLKIHKAYIQALSALYALVTMNACQQKGVYMLGDIEYTMNELFAQLGLDSSDEAIEKFIANNQLDDETTLKNAPFFNESQRAFVKEEWKQDAVWALVLDELNARLHEQVQ